jgi:tetratricopeptide (TPR) repeat protein
MRRTILIGAVACAVAAGMAWASGGAPAPMGGGSGPSGAPRMTPEQMAGMQYNDGLKLQEKADKLIAEAAGAPDAKRKAKLESDASKAYTKARGKFENAIEKDPKMYAAHGALGYARRRLGDFEGSLQAYATALQINPGYTPAIEYRGEAYLGLGRLEDAKKAYMDLFTADRPRADELSTAMAKWVEAKRLDPAGVDPQALEEFSTWLSQRLEIARQTTALLPATNTRW